MLTRRENLLVRPWQQRRFHHHRKKVESALPAIDVGPPAERGHVSCKLKQVQSESERCAQIGRDNCALVLRLAHIMRTSRVDNGWRQPPPTFLRRVGIYLDPASAFPPSPPHRPCPRARPTPGTLGTLEALEAAEEGSQDSEGRNLRCSACHPRTARRRETGRRVLSAVDGAKALDDGDRAAVVATTPTPPVPKPRHAHSAPASAPSDRGGPGPGLPLDQVVITYKALRLAISFPPHASVRIRSARGAHARVAGNSDERRQRQRQPLRPAPATPVRLQSPSPETRAA